MVFTIKMSCVLFSSDVAMNIISISTELSATLLCRLRSTSNTMMMMMIFKCNKFWSVCCFVVQICWALRQQFSIRTENFIFVYFVVLDAGKCIRKLIFIWITLIYSSNNNKKPLNQFAWEIVHLFIFFLLISHDNRMEGTIIKINIILFFL